MPSSVINLSALTGDKPIWQSITAWGLVVFFGLTAALDQACAGGVFSDDLCGKLTGWSEALGAILVTLGIRRAATAPNTG